jgi:hypothetical protein
MAIIHNTTMTPTKLDLLTGWLPEQPWYQGTGQPPVLARAGGFRLDDPLGEVGIEFMVVTDASGEQVTAYLVPMTYRAAALDGAADALIGTSEHGVLGRRWIYDGSRDPVLIAQLVAFIQGEAQAQAQSASDTPDPTVTGRPAAGVPLAFAASAVTASGPDRTDLAIQTSSPDGQPNGRILLRVHRVLRPGGEPGQPGVSASWRLPGGAPARATFATAHYHP